MISCLPTLVALFLIGLGLGDSPLVILSLCSLVLFFVISLGWFFYVFVFCFSLFFSFSFCSPLCILCVFYALLSFFNIIFLLIKKKNSFGDRNRNRVINKKRGFTDKNSFCKISCTFPFHLLVHIIANVFLHWCVPFVVSVIISII